MANGYFLGIALERVNPDYYQGWDGYLAGTIPDAKLFENELTNRGYQSELVLTENATLENIVRKFEEYSQKVQRGDTLVILYSGHGGYYKDDNGDERDGRDETWCLYDGELLDDRIWEMLQKFQRGVRLLMFSDSCYSGTAYKVVQEPNLRRKENDIVATLKWFGGSRDDQTSADLGTNGLFTKTFWESLYYLEEKFPKKRIPPSAVYKELKRRMPQDQIPTYFTEGPLSIKFNIQHIFKI